MTATSSPPPARVHKVIVYSDDVAVRDQIRTAVGRRPADDLGRIEWVECATAAQVLEAAEQGDVELAVLDGEAWPAGGMGLSRQMKDELEKCPRTLVIIARRDDAWLATWSLADAVTSHPIDPPTLTQAVADQLHAYESALPVRRAVDLTG